MIEMAIHDALAVDEILVTLLPGGVYTIAEVGEAGISRDNQATANAFDPTTRALRPCAMIRARGEQPTGAIADGAPARSARQVVELLFYQAGGADSIYAACLRARVLLDYQQLDGAHLAWNGEPYGIQYDDEGFGGAYVLRSDYVVQSVWTG